MNRLIVTMLTVSLISACGGGSSGGTSDSTSQVQLSKGAITGFGSVYVNGTRFNTDSAVVTRGDVTVNSVQDLSVGMVVTVRDNNNNAIASSVNFDEDVKGPLDAAITSFATAFSVMGQTVVVDSGTVIDNSLSLPVAAGQVLEVSGFRQSDDSIMATFIEIKSPANTSNYKTIGNVRLVDTNAKTFLIDQLQVNYEVADINDLNGGNPAEGQLVEVKDENKTYIAGSRVLRASKVEPASAFGGENSSSNSLPGLFQIESVVSAVPVPGSQFQIPNFTVNILPSTTFRFGTLDDIGVGTVLQIKATVNTANVLDARRITFKRNSVRIEAPVDNNGVDVANNQVTVLGLKVQLNASTRIRDKRDDVEAFGISDISPSDFLEIRGFLGASDNGLIASRLEREDNDDKVEIRSIATSVNKTARSVDLLGKTITAGADTRFEDINGNSMLEGDFFDAITLGLSIVKVEWEPFSDTSLAPSEMELEDEFSNE